jgi:hypothetical protein
MNLLDKLARALAKESGASSDGFRYDENQQHWERLAIVVLRVIEEDHVIFSKHGVSHGSF